MVVYTRVMKRRLIFVFSTAFLAFRAACECWHGLPNHFSVPSFSITSSECHTARFVSSSHSDERIAWVITGFWTIKHLRIGCLWYNSDHPRGRQNWKNPGTMRRKKKENHLLLCCCRVNMASISLSMGTRQKVQVSMTPAKTLAQALAEYCSKFDLDPSEHTLVHNKKVLDLSLSWRLSGISANANLEVRKAASSSKAGTRRISDILHKTPSSAPCGRSRYAESFSCPYSNHTVFWLCIMIG